MLPKFDITVRPNKKSDNCEISQPPGSSYFERYLSPEKSRCFRQTINLCQSLTKRPGVYSAITMCSAGFEYTGNGDTARCTDCHLEVSGWISDMKPFEIHAQRSPQCDFVRKMAPEKIVTRPNLASTFSTLTDEERPLKRQKTTSNNGNYESCILVEIGLLKEIRRRTFSHWPHRASPSSAQMIEAGFFNCNVGDRVICLYCNLVCQQWLSNVDDPWEVHRTLSPKCPYVIAKLKREQKTPTLIINDGTTSEYMRDVTDNNRFRLNEIVYTAACHPAYTEIPRRHASFSTWPNENSPSVDDFVRAGFFYTGSKTTTTCFYCNGSLQNWGANDNPTIEHARWCPHCAYAKELCGAELYRKIQETKKIQNERKNNPPFPAPIGINNFNPVRDSTQPSDQNGLSPYIAARLDLPMSYNLLGQNFPLSTIRRCWEDQLLSKHKDFTDSSELLVACMILQKQIELGVEQGNNIIIPSEYLRELRQKNQTGHMPLNPIHNVSP